VRVCDDNNEHFQTSHLSVSRIQNRHSTFLVLAALPPTALFKTECRVEHLLSRKCSLHPPKIRSQPDVAK